MNYVNLAFYTQLTNFSLLFKITFFKNNIFFKMFEKKYYPMYKLLECDRNSDYVVFKVNLSLI